MKFPHPLRYLDAKWDQAMAPTPLEEKVAEAMKAARQKIVNCDHTIREHAFQKHMAKCEIQGMIQWFEQEKQNATP